MDFNEFLQQVRKESKRQLKYYPSDKIDPETYARAVKLVEEVGELCAEILKHDSLQRKEKGENNKEDIAEEMADVIITAFLLAIRLDIDLEKALEQKMLKIADRYNGF